MPQLELSLLTEAGRNSMARDEGEKDDPCDDWSDRPIPKTVPDRTQRPVKRPVRGRKQSDFQREKLRMAKTKEV